MEKTKKYWENLAVILSSMKRFRKAVLEARKIWGVPDNGLPSESRARWYSSLFANPDIDLNEHLRQGELFELLPANKKIMKVLEDFSENFNLDSRWYNTLLMHISAGTKIDPPSGRSSIQPSLNDIRLPQDKLEVKRISIDIFKETKPQDLVDIWPQIRKWQRMMKVRQPEKRRPIQGQNVKRYIKVRKLEDKGLSHAEIAKKYPKLGFSVNSDVSNFKKEVEERFAPNKN